MPRLFRDLLPSPVVAARHRRPLSTVWGTCGLAQATAGLCSGPGDSTGDARGSSFLQFHPAASLRSPSARCPPGPFSQPHRYRPARRSENGPPKSPRTSLPSRGKCCHEGRQPLLVPEQVPQLERGGRQLAAAGGGVRCGRHGCRTSPSLLAGCGKAPGRSPQGMLRRKDRRILNICIVNICIFTAFVVACLQAAHSGAWLNYHDLFASPSPVPVQPWSS